MKFLNNDDAERLANQLLREFWVHDNKINYPIDAYWIATKKGLRVSEVFDMDSSIAGRIEIKSGQGLIFINKKYSINRKRFTCAHALGHYIDREENEILNEDFCHTDYRNHVSKREDGVHEIFATEFAANLLMPTQHFVEAYEQLKGDALCISTFFRVTSGMFHYKRRCLENEGVLKKKEIVC
jgi:Zn-dependent peptidase ImmA (M78 family)